MVVAKLVVAYDLVFEEKEKSHGLPYVVRLVFTSNKTMESSKYETWVENKHLLGRALVGVLVSHVKASKK